MFKTQYQQVDQLIDELLERTKDVLGSDLEAMYLFGSLVGGDFDMQKSDIDLLVIVKDVISESQLHKLKTMYESFVKSNPEWENRIEVAYVSIEGMRHFKSKTNTIARISPGEPLHLRDMDINWLLDWHMVQNQGMTIYGPPPNTYIPRISDEEYVQSILSILPEHQASSLQAKHKGYQAYIVMSFCRNLYAIKHAKQVSKIAGARWAAKQYPQWAEFINRAVSWRGMQDKSESLDTQNETIEFVEFAMKESQKL